MATYGFIFARAGSKGVPGKNVKSLAGKPLILWSIEQGLLNQQIDQLFVSTDGDEIADVAVAAGASLIRRPIELAGDKSPEWLAWQHAINEVKLANGATDSDWFISLPATSPLRVQEDIEQALTTFATGQFDMVFGVTAAARNPYFNMVTKQANGEVALVCAQAQFARRQDVPQVHDMTTVAYVSTFGHILQATGVFDGRCGAFDVPAERAVDIDTPFDFFVAEQTMLSRLNNEKY